MTQKNRLPEGGRIDRARPLNFLFNGRRYAGFAGDTLASALLANDRPHALNEPFALERFSTGHIIDEHGAAGVAH